MKSRLTIFLHILVILVLFTGCQGTLVPVPPETSPDINGPINLPEVLDSFPEINERHPDVEEAYRPVAQSGSLRLYLRDETSAIIVEDLRANKLWRSSPVDLADNKGTTNAWRAQIEVPVQVAYVDAERSQAKNIKPDKNILSYTPVQNGVMVTYEFSDLDLGFSVVYSINDDYLDAFIPDSSVMENGTNYLVNVDLLAFFGATHDGDPGYIVYPDGSGAIMSFTTPHPPEVQRITSVIYGTDASGGFTASEVYKELVFMPVFGMSHGDTAFVGMITHGDFDATVNVARSGKGINYNHVWGQFLFRRQGRFSLTGGQPAWLFQPDRISVDRQIRFQFLNGEDANYVEMASRYRDFLLNERGVKRLSGSPPLMNLAFFMGTERRTWFLADMISMTTFEQVQKILDELVADGVERADVTLYMWNQGATGNKYPERLPVDERLGGEEGLRALASDMDARGQRLFLQDNYLFVEPGAKGVQPYLDAIRGVDGLPIGDSETGYLLNPQVALRQFAARDIPKIAELGPEGLHFEMFSSLALPDKNQRYPLSREAFAASWMQIAKLARELVGAVSMDGGNIYVLPYTDRLDFVSVDSTHYDLFEETIPFYHIVVHGLVQYTGTPYNLISDGRRMFLRQIEYGVIPFFVLTNESSAQLMRTNANFLYSSEFSFWREEIKTQYQLMEQLEPLMTQFITGHARLAQDVYETTYESGTRVIVNYSQAEYTAGGVSVPAMDFVVVTGD